jgi:hypothetical protein
MKLALRYRVNYKNSDGDILEDEFDVDFSGVENDTSLDETARRVLIEYILAQDGSVKKIIKIGQQWK